MSYCLFDTAKCEGGSTPVLWNNFIDTLVELHTDWGDTNARECDRIINRELQNWGAWTVDTYGESSGLLVDFALHFESEEQASAFVLRWA